MPPSGFHTSLVLVPFPCILPLHKGIECEICIQKEGSRHLEFLLSEYALFLAGSLGPYLAQPEAKSLCKDA